MMRKMKSLKKRAALSIALSGALVLTACANTEDTQGSMQGHDMSSMNQTDSSGVSMKPDQPFEVLTGNTFTLTAKESMLHLDEKTMRTA